MVSLKERFWSKVDKSGDCWLWIASVNNTGYGEFGIGRKVVKAHRVAYELVVGKIPSKMCVLHRCDNPPCVNPTHLFIGTLKDNAVDMTKKGRRYKPYNKGSKHGNAKLTEESVMEMRKLYPNASTLKEYLVIGKKYGVSRRTVARALRSESWNHI